VGFAGSRRFVGLGFGPIQAGLFAYEAQRTGDYAPPLVVDVRADLVAALRAADGRFVVNIAHADGVEAAVVGPVEAMDSRVAEERARIIAAIADADELATALPSVAFYRSEVPWSPHRLIADALGRRTRSEPLIIFCAENHRGAAGLLEAAIRAEAVVDDAGQLRRRASFVDTVIGKMSGVIDDPGEIATLGLRTVTPALPQAFLVEAFDRILVSTVDPAGGPHALHPGIPALREVPDLEPFEAAKLLGHNATHALAGFLGSLLGLERVADLEHVPGAMAFLRTAFVAESGAVLVARYGGADPLFSPEGYAAFADDLLARMVNPYLADTIARAARDPSRKLGWDDRLVGLLRLGLAEGVPTPRYAMGVAAGLELLGREEATSAAPPEGSLAGSQAVALPRGAPDGWIDLLRACWQGDVDPVEASAVTALVEEGRAWLQRWRLGGFAALPATGGPVAARGVERVGLGD
jgi:mannitol-1-phosphate 5-dehydrogenase